MSTSITSSASAHAIGQWLQLGGLAGFVAGVVLSVHHYATGICFLAGAAAFYIGRKLKSA